MKTCDICGNQHKHVTKCLVCWKDVCYDCWIKSKILQTHFYCKECAEKVEKIDTENINKQNVIVENLTTKLDKQKCILNGMKAELRMKIGKLSRKVQKKGK